MQQYKEERLKEQQALHADADALAQELERMTALVGVKDAAIEELKGKVESLRWGRRPGQSSFAALPAV